jgi:hypothetical protein
MIRQYSLRRHNVAWVESFDMALSCIVGRRIGFPSGRHAAIEYFITRWGKDPWPIVRTDNVLIPIFLALIFFVVLPAVFVGKHLGNKYLMASGLTVSIATLCFIQFARPLTANIYWCVWVCVWVCICMCGCGCVVSCSVVIVGLRRIGEAHHLPPTYLHTNHHPPPPPPYTTTPRQ